MRFLLLFFIGLSLSAFSQSVKVSGTCTDKKGEVLEFVNIKVKNDSVFSLVTDEYGKYSFQATKGDTITITYQIEEFSDMKTVIVNKAPNLTLDDVKFPFTVLQVTIQGDRRDPFEIPKLPLVNAQNLPMGSIERSLVYMTAASSNNELTTNYNVRGGSYDENLVYVNGFNVYRPFLTRSGQQEGMSFINSALVSSVRFSAGGFDAQYGDKMSSVLDIEYKTPTKFRGSGMGSLLGAEAHIEDQPTTRFNYLVGARYRANGYLLNSLPSKGSYNPVFFDGQFLTNFALKENLTLSFLGHFSSNQYRFAPQTQETDFGTANEAYSFKVYFDGQENTRFQTMFGGTSLKHVSDNKKTKLDFYATVFNTVEREYFDIQGQYFINELETDPSKEEFGDSIAVLGIGTFLNHARNKLNATIINVYHEGQNQLKSGFKDDNREHFTSHVLRWGVNYQHDDFYDVLSEWKMIDSAGYSQPQIDNDEVDLFETIKGKLNLSSNRITGFTQINSSWSSTKRDFVVSLKTKERKTKIKSIITDTIIESTTKWALNAGMRSGYTTVNQEFFLTPRVSLIYYPRVYLVNKGRISRRNMNIHLASGMYYQPPFYREFRTFAGQLNTNVKSQKSFHIVSGADMYFNMWERDMPFKLSAEVFYKYMWDVNPYEIDNVRTRYYAENNAVAYAYGLDINVHGQFVDGIESFFKVGLLSTKEDLLNDSYKEYYNAAGETIIFGSSEDQTIVDSATIYPGYVPRPTDQLFTFGALVQDRMPGFESFSVQMGMQFGTGLPYGPPDNNRYKDTLRLKSYFRVDIGLSYDFLYKKTDKLNFWSKNFDDAIISFEVFNLLGINNVMSKQWIQDVEGKYFPVPNYLTQRRFNLKLILRF